MQNKKRYTFFKLISLIVLIQGVLQLFNLFGLILMGRSSTSAVKFYLGVILIGVYAIAAIIGGYTGLKNGDHYEGCRRCFYLGITLIIVTIATILLNILFKAYAVTQLQALIVPVLFMLLTILCGRKND